MSDPRFDPVPTDLRRGEREALRRLFLAGAQASAVQHLRALIENANREREWGVANGYERDLRDLLSAIAAIVEQA